jgi:hypothetical protein
VPEVAINAAIAGVGRAGVSSSFVIASSSGT